jgi:hypothetical protein
LRGEKCSQRILWRARKPKPLNNDIEIEIVYSFAILNGIYDPDVGLDA